MRTRISCSSKGSRILIGVPGLPYNSAKVHVFEYDEQNGWKQLGYINAHGDNAYLCQGAFSFSGEGNRVAMGCTISAGSFQILELKKVPEMQ